MILVGIVDVDFVFVEQLQCLLYGAYRFLNTRCILSASLWYGIV
jgi:hypothetical protein